MADWIAGARVPWFEVDGTAGSILEKEAGKEAGATYRKNGR